MFMASCVQAEKPAESSETSEATELLEPGISVDDAVNAPTVETPADIANAEAPSAETKAPVIEPKKPKKTSTPKTEIDPVIETPTEEPVEVEASPEKELVTEVTPTEIPEPAPQTAPSHVIWDGLLKKHVTSTGTVNYAAIKSSKDVLQSYLDLLAANPPRSDWSRNEKMAYWINAYNAFTVKLIIDNYPLNSITDLHGGKAWDVKWIKLGDKTYSLNQIENDILRPIFNDARIHFAVNCAAKSCPPLHNRAFTASNLNAQLESQAKSFINNPQYNTLSGNSVKISKIFDWYEVDFGNVINYLNDYSDVKIESGAAINYHDYNWKLNGK